MLAIPGTADTTELTGLVELPELPELAAVELSVAVVLAVAEPDCNALVNLAKKP